MRRRRVFGFELVARFMRFARFMWFAWFARSLSRA